MTGWRAKDMPLGELAHFHDTFKEFYNASSPENRPALFSRTRAGEMKSTVLVPVHRAAVVESLSPGGWRDYPDAAEEEWKLLVGDDSAFDDLGLRRKTVAQ